MRRLSIQAALVGVVSVVVACQSTTTSEPGEPNNPTPPTGIHPQPQPTKTEASFTAPCNAQKCGDAPENLKKPKCKPVPTECEWSEDQTVSYAPCEESKCGVAPGPEVCPTGTTFKGNQCGSENDAACAWTTACAPPRSTTPCKTSNGCGDGKPEIGVICKDGSNGDLACMQFADDCQWQPTCE